MSLEVCLNEIIGLSVNDCPCTEGGRPLNYNVSLSGYYIDNLQFGIPINFPNTALECGQNNVWELLERARIEGLNEFITDFMLSLYSNRKGIKGFSGSICDNHKANAPITSITKDYLGKTLVSAKLKGAVFILSRVCLIVDKNITTDIQIYSSQNNALLATIPITTTANFDSCVDLTTPLSLPLTDKYGIPINYHIVYDRKTALPLNAPADCGCYGTVKEWKEYFSIQSFETDSLPYYAPTAEKCATNEYCNGLSVAGTITCDPLAWLCQQTEFKTDIFLRTMSKLIMIYSVNKFISALLRNPNTAFASISSIEMMQSRLQQNAEMIPDTMNWLAQNMPIDASDCFTCKDEFGMTKKALIV